MSNQCVHPQRYIYHQSQHSYIPSHALLSPFKWMDDCTTCTEVSGATTMQRQMFSASRGSCRRRKFRFGSRRGWEQLWICLTAISVVETIQKETATTQSFSFPWVTHHPALVHDVSTFLFIAYFPCKVCTRTFGYKNSGITELNISSFMQRWWDCTGVLWFCTILNYCRLAFSLKSNFVLDNDSKIKFNIVGVGLIQGIRVEMSLELS